MRPNTDTGQDLAYAAGNVHEPETCIGCHNSLCRTSACELCDDCPDPDPNFDLERIWLSIVKAAKDGLRKSKYRREQNIPVDSSNFQEMIQEPTSILLDMLDKLLDATNSSTAKPEVE